MSKYKNYYQYSEIEIGKSKNSNLVLVGMTEQGLKSELLQFGEDGEYTAYVIDDDFEIPSHFQLVHSFKKWMRVYDDDRSTFELLNASEINVYRYGDLGCIIQFKKGKWHDFHEYEERVLGRSDSINTSVYLVGMTEQGLEAKVLSFGSYGKYIIYLIEDDDFEIPKEFQLVHSFKDWMRIYDDDTVTFRLFDESEINVYRHGNYDCIIQIKE